MTRHLTDEQIDLLADPRSGTDEPELELAEHLASCAQCQEELAFARSVDRQLDAVPGLVAPPELLDGVMSAIAEARARHRQITIWLASLAAVLTVMLVWWLAAGGAAAVALDALEAARVARIFAQVITAVGGSLPVEALVGSALVLLAAATALGRLMAKIQRGPDATAAAG